MFHLSVLKATLNFFTIGWYGDAELGATGLVSVAVLSNRHRPSGESTTFLPSSVTARRSFALIAAEVKVISTIKRACINSFMFFSQVAESSPQFMATDLCLSEVKSATVSVVCANSLL